MTYRTRSAFEISLIFAVIAAITVLVIVGRTTECALGDAGCEVGDDESFAQNIIWASGTAFEVEMDHAATAGRTVTFPDLTGTVVYTTGGQTLTSHDIDTPDIDGGTIDDATLGGVDPVTLQGLDFDGLVAGDILYGSGADTLASSRRRTILTCSP